MSFLTLFFPVNGIAASLLYTLNFLTFKRTPHFEMAVYLSLSLTHRAGKSSPVDAMISACSVLFTLVLFSELNGRLVTVALPSSSAEDAAADRVGLDGVLDDDSMLKPAIIRPTYRRSLTLDDNVKDEESPQLVIISVSYRAITSLKLKKYMIDLFLSNVI